MPMGQVGQGTHYQFGAPSVEGEVLRFRQKDNIGGKLVLLFEAPVSTRDITYSVEVSDTGAPGDWIATEADENLVAITDIVISPKTTREHVLLLRPTVDRFMRIIAFGSDQAGVTIKGNEMLELINVQNEQGGGPGDD